MSEAVDNSPIHPPAVALKATEQQSASTASTRHVAPDRGQRPSDWLYVHAMDLNAQGVGHREDGKVVFIDGALPGEWVTAQVHRKKSNWEMASLSAVQEPSSQRVAQPKCPHFGLHAGSCGGCKMQHLQPTTQVAIKQRVLEDNLWHLGKVRPNFILRAIEGPTWGYRFRARLSVRYVAKKGTVLVGFHERKSRYVADMASCAVLPKHVSDLLLPLRDLFMSMAARASCAQLEVACTETQTGLVLRHLEPLSDDDKQRLRAFAIRHSGEGPSDTPSASPSPLPRIMWYLQSKGPDTITLLDEGDEDLFYELPAYGVHMPFRPADFTQVNPYINEVLVSRALNLLGVQKHERVFDWFCGLGNFTLPLATQGAEVVGVEGSEILVNRGIANYARFYASKKTVAPTSFIARNLFEMTADTLRADGNAHKWLVDPPREGAMALVSALVDALSDPDLNAATGWVAPTRIVYVSCNPATLARDAGILVASGHYQLTSAGVVNMFPHTAHVESMAVFERTAV
ncbi:MAG: 23S rRNA (uracil(1939)-C(5))-methyltransferase RlmD [Burkholderiaceae bacterium]